MQAIFRPCRCLDRLDVVGGLDQRFGRAGVEPGEAPAEALDAELAAAEVFAVDVGDLQLAARRGLEVGGDVEHLVVVEVEAGDGEVRLGAARASPRSRRAARRRRTRRRRSARGPSPGRRTRSRPRGARRRGRAWPGTPGRRRCCRPGSGRRCRPPTNSRPIRNACARPPGWGCTAYWIERPIWLPSPSTRSKPPMSVGVEIRRISRMPAEHQGRERVIDHRLVVDRQQLLADRPRDRVQPRARSAGQDDPFGKRAATAMIATLGSLVRGSIHAVPMLAGRWIATRQNTSILTDDSEISQGPASRPPGRSGPR